jgi:hypothetical protein
MAVIDLTEWANELSDGESGVLLHDDFNVSVIVWFSVIWAVNIS